MGMLAYLLSFYAVPLTCSFPLITFASELLHCLGNGCESVLPILSVERTLSEVSTMTWSNTRHPSTKKKNPCRGNAVIFNKCLMISNLKGDIMQKREVIHFSAGNVHLIAFHSVPAKLPVPYISQPLFIQNWNQSSAKINPPFSVRSYPQGLSSFL